MDVRVAAVWVDRLEAHQAEHARIMADRDRLISEAREAGLGPTLIGKSIGLSAVQVHRILAAAQN